MFNRGSSDRIAPNEDAKFDFRQMMFHAAEQYADLLDKHGLSVEDCFNYSLKIKASGEGRANYPHIKVELGSKFLEGKMHAFLMDKGNHEAVTKMVTRSGEHTVVDIDKLEGLNYRDQHDFLFALNKSIKAGEADHEIEALKQARLETASVNKPN